MTDGIRASVVAGASLFCIATLGRAQAPAVSEQLFPPGEHRDLVVRACAACHQPEMVVSKRRSAAAWDEIIGRMIDRGAVASDEEQQQILEYLVRFYGAD